MKRVLKLILAASCLFFAVGKAQALTVVEGGSRSARTGAAFGKGLADGMQRSIEDAQRAQAERRREDAPRREAERRRELARDLITNYDPANHELCIADILESELSRETKSWIIDHVNKVHNMWLKQKEFEKKHD